MAAAGSPPIYSVLHITDLHLLRDKRGCMLGMNTAESLRAVLAAATRERRLAALLVTGDIAQEPTTAVYRRCLGILREFHAGPLLCLPGNHDLLAPMLEAGMTMQPIRLGRWCIVGWDTHEDDHPGAVWREASPATSERAQAAIPENLETGATGPINANEPIARTWQALLAEIGRAKGHVLVATHHPLIDVGCPWLDKDRLPNAEQALDALAEMPSVQAVAFGHAHQDLQAQHGKLALFGTPSTCFQFKPRSCKFGLDDTGPGYRWLHLSDDGRLQTQVRRI